MVFQLELYKNSEAYVFVGADEIWDVLDEHILKIMSIASSPYVKFIEQELNGWKHTLIKMQEIIEEWSKAQKKWADLQPVFSSERYS